MQDRDLRQHCKKVLEGLNFPDTFDVDDLADRFEELRNRPISLVPIPLPSGAGSPNGLWVATDDADYIMYQKNTTTAHQKHIIRHEFGHVALSHKATPVMSDEVSRLLMPTLDPTLVRMVLGRTGEYTKDEEWAAEYFASLIPAQANEAARKAPVPLRPEVATLIRNLERSLERGT